jgi:hypothetical protein
MSSKSVDLDPVDPEHVGRVTVDIDGYVDDFEQTATRAYYNLDHVADETEVHVSSGGEGIHIVGWFKRSVSVPERIHMRRSLGDDQKRIAIDIERAMNGVYTGVLWSDKTHNSGPEESPEYRPGKDRDFRDIHDALAHIRVTTTDDAERMARLAEHGHKRAPALAGRAYGGEGK